MFDKEHTRPVSLIVFIIVLNYAGTFSNDFVWDDHSFIVNRPEIRHADHITESFITDTRGVYRPVREAFYVLSYAFWGQKTVGYHLNAILIHTFATIIIYFFLEGVLNRRIALLSALLFASHPIHTESITFMTSSFDEIGVVFFFASIFFYSTSNMDNKRYVASVIFAFLAFFTYEVTLILPFLVVLYDHSFNKIDAKKARRYLPFFAGVFFYLLLRFFAVGVVGRMPVYHGGSFYSTAITMSKVFIDYILKLILPVDLTITPVVTIYKSFFEPNVLISFAIIIGILLSTWNMRKHRAFFFGSIWFFVTLLPVSNIIPIQTLMAERYLYIPSFGFCLILAIAFNEAYERFQVKKEIVSLTFVVLLLLYSAGTIDRNSEWKDEMTLWSDTVLTSPNSDMAHFGLGAVYLREDRIRDASIEFEKATVIDQTGLTYFLVGETYFLKGMYDESIAAYKKGLEIHPLSAKGYTSLGDAYFGKGDYNESISSYSKAINIDPHQEYAHLGIGNAYFEMKMYDEAALEYLQTVRINPNNHLAHYSLGNTYFNTGWTDLALEEYMKSISINQSHAPSYLNLGNAYIIKGLPYDAIENYKMAITLNPNVYMPHYNLGYAYTVIGSYNSAIAEFKKAIVLAPERPEIHYNLGNTYYIQEDYELAIEAFKRTLEIDPNNADAHNNLGVIYRDIGEYDKAIEELEKAVQLDQNNERYRRNLEGLKNIQ